MPRISRLAIYVCLASALCPGCHLAPPPEDLDGFIKYQMDKTHIPGLAAAVFSAEGDSWAEGYGWANIKEGRSATEDTLFQLASISKLVTATAAMQLVETGLLDLDADINTYLPFPIRNPYHPLAPITLRMLLTHTSSLRDNGDVYESLYEWGADSPISLHDLIEGFYTPSGRWYKKSDCFGKAAPGMAAEYSNVGFALVGYIVEVVAGTPFDLYCDGHIFTPLGMTETSWFLRGLEQNRIAMPYRDASLLGCVRYKPYGQYGYPDYPSGQIRTSVTQFSRLFRAFMNQGKLDGVAILQPETVEQMLTVQNPETGPYQGLGWILLPQDDGTVLFGHGGGEHGVLTMAWFRPGDSVGVFVFTNGDPNDLLQYRSKKRVAAIMAILNRLFSESATMRPLRNG